jgi:hypothetical protein
LLSFEPALTGRRATLARRNLSVALVVPRRLGFPHRLLEQELSDGGSERRPLLLLDGLSSPPWGGWFELPGSVPVLGLLGQAVSFVGGVVAGGPRYAALPVRLGRPGSGGDRLGWR